MRHFVRRNSVGRVLKIEYLAFHECRIVNGKKIRYFYRNNVYYQVSIVLKCVILCVIKTEKIVLYLVMHKCYNVVC